MRKWIETLVIHPESYMDFKDWIEETQNALMEKTIQLLEKGKADSSKMKLGELSFCKGLRAKVANEYKEHQLRIGER